ncbi:MAG TPA: glycosyltransferase [Polyangiaceae bacterium]|nr:glycosyltransferase [Polyangiaceae bacterium]
MTSALDLVIIGLSITSSWGNGHATTYRGLVRELARRGHRVLFLERDVPWYAENRDMPDPPWCETRLYASYEDLVERFRARVRAADVVVVGSYVPEGARVGAWVTSLARGKCAFYDIDTPVTLRSVERGACEYLTGELISRYELYLSFTGGPLLARLERRFGAARARPLYCSVDPSVHFPEPREADWDLGYIGTYSTDRQPVLDRLLLEPARTWQEGRFIVAGPQYPRDIAWPANVQRTDHLAPADHRRFYSGQRFGLNVTRADMVKTGWSPSVRLFEAAACGTPIVSDWWPGLESFFEPGRDILVARTARDVLSILREMPERDRAAIARSARARVLSEHTAARRAETLEQWLQELLDAGAVQRAGGLRRRAAEAT